MQIKKNYILCGKHNNKEGFHGWLKINADIGEEIMVNVSVTLGSADLRVHQLLKLGRGAVVELDRDVNDYVDIYANDVLIGHGEVVITESDKIGISITDTIKK